MKRQTIGRKRASNVICRIKGKHDYLVVVGAHYDRIGPGPGVADNWSGIVLASQLIEALEHTQPNLTWKIVAFGAEESRTYWSKAYFRKHGSGPIISMINIDTLGLGSLKVDIRSDRGLKCIAERIASDIGGQLSPSLLRESTGDWEPFDRQGIAVLSLHSLDRRLIGKLHTRKDSWPAIAENRMQEAWRLLLNISHFLNQRQV